MCVYCAGVYCPLIEGPAGGRRGRCLEGSLYLYFPLDKLHIDDSNLPFVVHRVNWKYLFLLATGPLGRVLLKTGRNIYLGFAGVCGIFYCGAVQRVSLGCVVFGIRVCN